MGLKQKLKNRRSQPARSKEGPGPEKGVPKRHVSEPEPERKTVHAAPKKVERTTPAELGFQIADEEKGFPVVAKAVEEESPARAEKGKAAPAEDRSQKKEPSRRKGVPVVPFLALVVVLAGGLIYLGQGIMAPSILYGVVGLLVVGSIVVLVVMSPKSRPEKKQEKEQGKGQEKETESSGSPQGEEPSKVQGNVLVDGTLLETDFDRLYVLLKRSNKLSLEEISSKFKIDKKKAEEWGEIFESYELARLDYPLLGDPVLVFLGQKVPEDHIKKKKQKKSMMVVNLVVLGLFLLAGLYYTLTTLGFFASEEIVTQEMIIATPVPKVPADRNVSSLPLDPGADDGDAEGATDGG